jgi:malonate transporter and related proteins
MPPLIEALAPTFLLIVIGWWMRRSAFVPDTFWPPAERLIYFVLFPALLVSSTAKADLAGLDLPAIGGAMFLAVAVTAAFVVLLRRRVAADDAALTSVVQGSIRPNTYVGLAACAALHGTPGTAIMAIGIVAVIPTVNALSVLALIRWGTTAKRGSGLARVAKGIATNPLILAVLAGAMLNGAGVHRIPLATPLLDVLGAASLPLGLLAVGAGLDIPALRTSARSIAWSSMLKLAVLPGLTAAFAWWFGVTGLPLAVALLYNGLPCSANSYVLARQMGGDHRLMAGIITAQTLLAVATLPLIVLLVPV